MLSKLGSHQAKTKIKTRAARKSVVAHAGVLGLVTSLVGAGCLQQRGSHDEYGRSSHQLVTSELRPFPQGGGFPGCPTCVKPNVTQTTMNNDIKTYYTEWKSFLLKTFPTDSTKSLSGLKYLMAGANGAISGWPSNVTAVSSSEAHGYLMLTTVLMAGANGDSGAKAIFDSANALRKACPSSTDSRLMSWVIPSNGDCRNSTTAGSDGVAKQAPATDGDMDFAYALLLAYNQWGDVAYLDEAKTVIQAMKEKFITMAPTGQTNCSPGATGCYFPRLNIGDPNWTTSAPPESKPYLSRPSDYMTGHMRAFNEATGDQIWLQVETASINIMNQVKNSTTGLVPDFVAGTPPSPSTTGTGDEGLCYSCFDYNACRVPWRQAVAVAHYGTAGSKTIADKMVSWAKGKYTGGPSTMLAGATLSGGKLYDWTDISFTSPMVVAAIVNSAHQTWLNNGWTYIKGTAIKHDYYGNSITLLSMLLASGNWWKFTPPTACTPESDVQFCDRLNKDCGSVTAEDNCGTSRTVTSCGTCTSPATCGGGGLPNVCGTAPSQAPYGGTARAVPGTIQAEDYDTGGANVAYSDTTAGNTGGYHRTEDVDIGSSCGTGCYNIGWAAAGEWTEYTVDVGTAGIFNLQLRVAATSSTRTMHVEVDGTDVTGSIAVPNTGAYTTFNTVTVTNLSLTAGQKVVRVVLDTGSVNLDWFAFVSACTPESDTAFCSRLGKECGSVTANDNCGVTRTVTSCGTCTSPATCGGGGTANMCGTCAAETDAAFCARLGKNCGSVSGTDNCDASRTVSDCGTCTLPQSCGGGGTANVCGVVATQQPYGGTARNIPGTIQAEDYDTGGQDVAYNDATPTDNSMNTYRDSSGEGVDVESKAAGQYNIGAVSAGEWVEYTVNVTAGTYDLQVRVSATSTGKSIHVEMDGTNISGAISIPNTGSYSTFQTVTVANISLTAGQKVMRVVFDSSSVNLDWIAFATTNTSTYEYMEAENFTGSSTAPLVHVTDANASNGKAIWSTTSSSTGGVPADGHATFTFSLTSSGTYKLWGRFLSGTAGTPAGASDDSLWVRICPGTSVSGCTATWTQWNDISVRVGTTAYDWDDERNTPTANSVVTRSLAAGSHTLEIAYRENGLKMDRFLVTNDLAFSP
jgi:endo-1,4-beta-D-glucanase Y